MVSQYLLTYLQLYKMFHYKSRDRLLYLSEMKEEKTQKSLSLKRILQLRVFFFYTQKSFTLLFYL